MIGIYKITNKINGQSYVGQSINITKRWGDHIKASTDPANSEYLSPLHRAMRKYLIKTFLFEVLEECASPELNSREEKWIAILNTFENGYNQTRGGDSQVHVRGESHPNHKLTEAEVRDIRIRWSKREETCSEIFEDYKEKISKTGFVKVYTWQTWKEILPELNTIETKEWHKKRNLAENAVGRTSLDESVIREIRERRNAMKESKAAVRGDYMDLTAARFRDVWKHKTYVSIGPHLTEEVILYHGL